MRISELTEDFSANQIDTVKWTIFTAPPITHRLDGNKLYQTPGISSTGYGGIVSNESFDLTDDFAFIEVQQVVNASATAAETQFVVGIDDDNKYVFGYTNGSIYARQVVNAGGNDDQFVTYNALAHRFWRIREKNGIVYWEVSPDSYVWTEIRRANVGFAVTALDVTIQSGTYSNEANPGTSIFDNLNLHPLNTTVTKKRFSYKIYNQEALWDQAYFDLDHYDYNASQTWEGDVISDPTFTTTINSGVGECVVKLARAFDSFGEDTDVILNRQVDIFVYDNETPNGQLLYRGFISGYSPVLENDNEYVEIVLLGYTAELSWTILQDSFGNTGLSYLSEDPSDIFMDILDKYRAQGGVLSYDSSTIQTTGTTVSYTFNLVSIKDALDKVLELCPVRWYYFVSPDGKVYLKGPSSQVDHRFYVGKNVLYMRPEKRVENVRNEVYFVGGTPPGESQILRKYSRSSSVELYGRKSEVVQDQRVTVNTTADLMANRQLDYSDVPIVRTELTISDSNGQHQGKGYDIESVKVGQYITINNLKSSARDATLWDIAVFDVDNWDYQTNFITADILQIFSITYNADYISLQAAAKLPDVAKRVEDIERNLDTISLSTVPVTPTEV